jgi:vacuolar-type H+-ATPase subunit I/STV1
LSAKVAVKVENFIDKEGEVKARISDDNGGYGVAVDELNRSVQPLNEKLREYSVNLMKSLNEASAYAKSIAETSERIKKAHDLFNTKVEFAKSEINASIYDALSTCFNGWSSHISEQSATIENYLIKSFNWT